MSALFEPLTLRSLTVPNRLWMAPMCQYSAAPEGPAEGAPGDWHFQHLAARAAGGTGLILTEATAVSPEGRISPYDLGLWNDTQTAAFRRITDAIKAQNSVPGIQIAHAGRKASTERTWVDRGRALRPEEQYGWRPVGPSPVAFDERYTTPTELTGEQIAELVEKFAETARRALAAGFQVAEIHGAHGYLINQFLSPYSNRRTDAYGGSYENRTRLALEVVDAVRAVWPDELPVFFRISATDWLSEDASDDREGWTADETVRFAGDLREHGVDLLDTSTGGNAPDAKIAVAPGYQVPFAERVKKEAGLAVGAVGLITEARQAEKIVADGQADAVLLGRELLRSPSFAQHAARELGAATHLPQQYHRAV
ncbi:NADH:flavin oxidoreductase/NADH oxidase [Streptomyces noursei]|uniref:Oxidoreductase n=1 Tax=Streptomyces noursei TaxID=1971 RepID=A0A401RC12_STRNR|nr:NADH:flavin oxidoreductase/NADH oxidase [Streptomyces noursei]AKA07267.1 oxidoreductase [Streptomyces noursei ZPM]EOT03672.1 oxidoreductase [Streptomyces noursei CCRC 11814]EXU87409.1 oxidoreductase [Streptomyces noursei PD-1]UWS75820.1 NADH:flavin oxidoreductase/NADH oxidase [Streptomyces noursei]GCB95168.1 oxidoreductase [Streptomyces noursei]